MNFLINVFYPKRIEIAVGTVVEIHGVFDKVDHLIASCITDSSRGIVFQLHPNEVEEVKRYSGENPWKLPLAGQVVGSNQWGESTHLSVYPTGQTIFDFHQFTTARNQAAVPAFWKLADKQSKWRAVFEPDATIRRQHLQQGPKKMDMRHLATALRKYSKHNPGFKLELSLGYAENSLRKLLYSEQHLERLKIIDEWRRHLYASPRSDGRDYSLAQTQQDAVITFEAALASLYSSLDILAHLINEFYKVGLATNAVSIDNIVTKIRRGDDGATTEPPSLQKMFPELPLTKLLLEQRTLWIIELQEWRHKVIHECCLETGEIDQGGVLILRQLPAINDLPDVTQDATSLLRLWCSHLKNTLCQSIKMIEADGVTAVKMYEDLSTPRDQQKSLTSPDRSKASKVLCSFLDNWCADPKSEKDKYGHMYAGLTKEWKNQWGYNQFRNFIQNHPLKEYSFQGGTLTTTDRKYGEMFQQSAVMIFSNRKILWRFSLVPQGKYGFGLLLTPESTPLSFKKRLQMGILKTQQSGPDTGHRNIEFSSIIKNISNDSLTDVKVHIFSDFLLGCSVSLEALGESEEKPFNTLWENACLFAVEWLPAISAGLLYGNSTRVRVTYVLNVEEGSLWAEDLITPENQMPNQPSMTTFISERFTVSNAPITE